MGFRRWITYKLIQLVRKIMPDDARLFSVMLFLEADDTHIIDTTAMPKEATMSIVKMIYFHCCYSEHLKNGDTAKAAEFLNKMLQTESKEVQEAVKPVLH